MTIFEFVSSSGGTPDDDLGDFDIFLAASLTSGSERAKGYFVAAAENNVHMGVFLPNDASFLNLPRQLGYPGIDEQGAMAFILRLHQPELNDALGRRSDFTFLAEILSVHWFRALSDDHDRISFEDLQAAGNFTTLDGITMEIIGNTLVDGAPDVPNPEVRPPFDVAVSNGLVKMTYGVLLPSSLPDRSALGLDQVLLGTDSRDRLFGGDGNDLLMDGAGGDMLGGGGGQDTFLLAGDGSRDKILDFEPGQDMIDLTTWDIRYMTELHMKQRNDSSLLIYDGRNSAVLQAANGQISLEDLGSDVFIFGPGKKGIRVDGTDGRDRLTGTDGDDLIDGGLGRDFMAGGHGADVFIAGSDTFDVILDYAEELDSIVLEGWGVTNFEELSIAQMRPWLLQVTAGDFELRIRAADREIDVKDLGALDFILPG